MKRIGAVALLAALAMPASASPQSSPPCPLAALAPPRMEGVEQFVVVGQPQPCPPNGTREDFLVRTNFGDGVVAETPFRDGDELWFVGGTHAYRRAGTYQLTGTVTDRRTGVEQVLRRTIQIPNAPLAARRTARPTFPAGKRVRRTVARFSDGNRLATARDHRASIRWGDGSRSTGAVVKRGTGFAVVASHRYRSGGARTITIVVRDDRGATLRLRTPARVTRT